LRTICGGNEKDCTSKNKIIALKAGKASWQKVEKKPWKTQGKRQRHKKFPRRNARKKSLKKYREREADK